MDATVVASQEDKEDSKIDVNVYYIIKYTRVKKNKDIRINIFNIIILKLK